MTCSKDPLQCIHEIVDFKLLIPWRTLLDLNIMKNEKIILEQNFKKEKEESRLDLNAHTVLKYVQN